MSDSVPLSIQHSYPEQQQQSPSCDAQMASGEDMNVQLQQSYESGFLNTHPESEKDATRSHVIKQQLSDLSVQQPIHPEVPKEEVKSIVSDVSDSKSIYIGNVDYEATEQELLEHFSVSGAVERVNIMKNKVSGAPKGFAYLEFVSRESAQSAVDNLDGTLLRDRELKVSFKRTNLPGMSMTERGSIRGRGRGRGLRGNIRGRGRGVFRGLARGRGATRGVANRFAPY